MKLHLLSIILIITVIFLQMGCGGGSGESANTSDSDPGTDTFSISDLSFPSTVKSGDRITVSANVSGKESEIVLFQFLSNNGKSDITPHSGIVATKAGTGLLNLSYQAPAYPREYYYHLKVLNSDGEEIIKQFTVNVVN